MRSLRQDNARRVPRPEEYPIMNERLGQPFADEISQHSSDLIPDGFPRGVPADAQISTRDFEQATLNLSWPMPPFHWCGCFLQFSRLPLSGSFSRRDLDLIPKEESPSIALRRPATDSARDSPSRPDGVPESTRDQNSNVVGGDRLFGSLSVTREPSLVRLSHQCVLGNEFL